MIIKKTRVNNIDRYLKHIGETDKFYISVENTEANLSMLNNKNDSFEPLTNGVSVVPSIIGPSTRYNVDGKKLG